MADIKEIKIGDILHLNSGSPRLTVTNVDHEKNTVTVQWTTCETFPAETLTQLKSLMDRP